MAYVVDPPGFETVPLPSGSFTCALGREIRVEVRGDTRWFKTWHAPNTLIDGSTEESEVFRLGNLNPVVKATKRGYGSVTVAPPSHVTFSCMPVGELSDAMYTEPDPLGGTRYCLPEGTLLSVQVAQVSAGPDEWCTRGPLVLSERVGGGSTSHASTRALIHPTGVRVSGGACCCDDDDWFCFCGLPSSPQYHIFDGGPGGLIFTSRQVLDMYSDDLYFQGGSVTVCSDLPWADPTAPQTIYFEMKAYTGYQHLYTVVYNEDGEYVDTVYPARGLRDTTSIETSCAEGRLRGLAETVQQPTLKVDIEVEGNLVPAAVAGHFTFPKPDGCAGARKYYTCAHERPDPKSDIATELIAVKLNRNDGFVLRSWTGNCAYFDANGAYLGMLPESLPDDPDDWITDDTIYVKCLKANPTYMASATTEMAVLAGASVEGAAETVFAATTAKVVAMIVPPVEPTKVSFYDVENKDTLRTDAVISDEDDVYLIVSLNRAIINLSEYPYEIELCSYPCSYPYEIELCSCPLDGDQDWVNVELNEDDILAPDGKSIIVKITNDELVSIGLVRDVSDAVAETASCDFTAPTDSDQFDKEMGGFHPLLTEFKVPARMVGTGKDYACAPVKATTGYIIAGGADFIAVQTDKVWDVGLLQNQSDWLYISGHGRHGDGCLCGVLPSKVDWKKDLDLVIISSCSVLDVDDLNNNYEGSDHDASPGRKWATTGPKILLGYNFYAPADNHRGDPEFTAKIVKKLFERRFVNGETWEYAWGHANKDMARKWIRDSPHNACAIVVDGEQRTYWCWKKYYISRYWESVSF
ncbi:MAG: hypothetical protein ACOX5J_17620 [Candidatus Hydrogenedentales bacterium]